jgi:hypothetical protein
MLDKQASSPPLTVLSINANLRRIIEVFNRRKHDWDLTVHQISHVLDMDPNVVLATLQNNPNNFTVARNRFWNMISTSQDVPEVATTLETTRYPTYVWCSNDKVWKVALKSTRSTTSPVPPTPNANAPPARTVKDRIIRYILHSDLLHKCQMLTITEIGNGISVPVDAVRTTLKQFPEVFHVQNGTWWTLVKRRLPGAGARTFKPKPDISCQPDHSCSARSENVCVQYERVNAVATPCICSRSRRCGASVSPVLTGIGRAVARVLGLSSCSAEKLRLSAAVDDLLVCNFANLEYAKAESLTDAFKSHRNRRYYELLMRRKLLRVRALHGGSNEQYMNVITSVMYSSILSA